MSSVVFAGRAFLANLFLLPLSPLYRYYFRKDTGNNAELCIADCRFWGPKVFTSLCSAAMDQLRSADPDLFKALTSSGTITFWLQPQGIRQRIHSVVHRCYGVDPAYIAWETHGIVAFVISIYYMETFTPAFLGIPAATPSSEIASTRAAIDWLVSRDYPEELIEPLQLTLNCLMMRSR
jgi:hypothetical protein